MPAALVEPGFLDRKLDSRTAGHKGTRRAMHRSRWPRDRTKRKNPQYAGVEAEMAALYSA